MQHTVFNQQHGNAGGGGEQETTVHQAAGRGTAPVLAVVVLC